MKEEIITIGENKVLVGILTKPDLKPAGQDSTAVSSNKKPMVLLSNAGFLHRVGPYRQWVELARLLSEDGFRVFRFDLSGLGDSELRIDTHMDNERPTQDVIEVMDYLQKNHDDNHFILIGLCSGADINYSVGLRDERVVGTIFLDGLGYKTMGWYLHHYFYPLMNEKGFVKSINSLYLKIGNKLKRSLRCLFHQELSKPKHATAMRQFPHQQQAQKELRQLIERKVQMLFIYSNGAGEYFNHAHQFKTMFPKLEWKDEIQVQYNSDADHTFTQLNHRAKLHEIICNWLERF